MPIRTSLAEDSATGFRERRESRFGHLSPQRTWQNCRRFLSSLFAVWDSGFLLEKVHNKVGQTSRRFLAGPPRACPAGVMALSCPAPRLESGGSEPDKGTPTTPGPDLQR